MKIVVELWKSAQLLMESAIFQCGRLRAADNSRETKRSIPIGSTMAILGRDPLARTRARAPSIHGIEN